MQKFDAVLQQYPQEPNVHFRYGAFLNVQDSDRGIDEIKKALELAPDHVPALVGLTAIYLKREDAGDRAGLRRAGGESEPGRFFRAHVALGRALLAKEDPARAASELEAGR